MKTRKLITATAIAVIFGLIIKSHLNIFIVLAYVGTFLLLVGILTQNHDH